MGTIFICFWNRLGNGALLELKEQRNAKNQPLKAQSKRPNYPVVLCRTFVFYKLRLLHGWVHSFIQAVMAVFVGFMSRKIENTPKDVMLNSFQHLHRFFHASKEEILK